MTSEAKHAKRSRLERLPALSFAAIWALIGTFSAACFHDDVRQTVSTDAPTPVSRTTNRGKVPTSQSQQSLLVITDGYSIYTMEPAGRNLVQLAENVASTSPRWSPDRSQIAFASNLDGDFEIFVMNSDGSNLRQITNNQVNDGDPSWFPTGDRIAFASGYGAFASVHDIDAEIFTVKTDGSELTRLTYNNSSDTQPDVSPDGSTIAYVNNSIYLNGSVTIRAMNSDGSNDRLLIADRRRLFNGFKYADPTWSPDGNRIAFVEYRSLQNCKTVMIAESDGTDLVAISKSSSNCRNTDNHLLGEFDDIENVSWSPNGEEVAFSVVFPSFVLLFDNRYSCHKTELLSTNTHSRSVATTLATSRRGSCATEYHLPFTFTEFDW